MSDDPPKELRDAGEQHALYAALVAVIDSHPDPKHAAKIASSAIETLIVETMHRPDTPDHWLDGMQEFQRYWTMVVADKYS